MRWLAVLSICFYAGGKFCSHSTSLLVCVGNKFNRFDVILSRIINTTIFTLTNETVDPIDEIIFHVAPSAIC